MMTLKRFWLWLDCYCWLHTIQHCKECRDKRRENAIKNAWIATRRKDDMAYEIRLRRVK